LFARGEPERYAYQKSVRIRYCDVLGRLIDPFSSGSGSRRKTNMEKEENRGKSLGNKDVSRVAEPNP
jgi:hypothetical protein